MTEIEIAVLELLAMAPSSFAALCGYASRATGLHVSVDAAWVVLADFEQRNWVRAYQMRDDGSARVATDIDKQRAVATYRGWLAGTAEVRVGIHDEVGLWFQIEPDGRLEWETRAGDSHPRWVLDQDEPSCMITIQADSIALAEQALKDWERLDPKLRTLPKSRELTQLEESAPFRVQLRIAFERG